MAEKREKSPLAKALLESLKEKIITGVYKNGDSLTEMALAQEYNMSRTPIREALRQLEAMGLVKIVPNKGAVAQGLTEEEISDVFNIRIRVESMAAYLAAQNISNEQLQRLKLAQKEFEQNISVGNTGVVKETDSAFHDIIYEAAGSMPVKRVLQSMNTYMGYVRHESLKEKGRAMEAAREHALILKAIEDGDAILAEKLSYEHIKNAAEKNKACFILPFGGKNLE